MFRESAGEYEGGAGEDVSLVGGGRGAIPRSLRGCLIGCVDTMSRRMFEEIRPIRCFSSNVEDIFYMFCSVKCSSSDVCRMYNLMAYA